MKQAMLVGFDAIARQMQSPISAFMTPSHDNALSALLVRALLTNPAVRPIVVERGSEAQADALDNEHNIRTRPISRISAVDPSGEDIAIAAEEPIEIAGFAVDPLMAGSIVAVSRETPRLSPGVDVRIRSGMYTAPMLAAVSDVKPPEFVIIEAAPASDLTAILSRRGFRVSAGEANLRATTRRLLDQSRAAMQYYLSGAAASSVMADVAAAVVGSPTAPARYLAALANNTSLLSQEAAPVTLPTYTWREDTKLLRYLVGRLSKTELIVADDPAAWVYDLSPISSLFRIGALNAYLYVLTGGHGDKRLDDFFEESSIRYAKQARQVKMDHELIVATSRARQYVVIIEDKFGTDRILAILERLRSVTGARALGAPGGTLASALDSVQVTNPDAVLAALTKREREVVAVEYESRLAEWKASAENKCEHVRLVRRLRGATTDEVAQTALRSLSQYWLKPGQKPNTEAAKTWLLCRNCGHRTICPHVRDLVKMRGRTASYDEIRTHLQKYALRVESSGGDGHSYYCRICSEHLADAEEDSRLASKLGRFGDLDAGLRIRVWSVAVAAAAHVRFPVPTDGKRFAGVVADVVYPLLLAAEESASKKGRRRGARTADASDDVNEDIDPRTTLHIILFVYAYILDLVRSTRGERSREVGFDGVGIDAKEGAYAEAMLKLIATEHRGLISRIEDITADYLRARFIECYRLVRSEGASDLARPNSEEELALATAMDSAYRYAVTVAAVAGDLPLRRPSTPAEARTEFERVLGTSLPDLVKRARANAKDTARVETLTLEYRAKDPRVNLYTDIYEPDWAAAKIDIGELKRLGAEMAALVDPNVKYWLGGAAGGNPIDGVDTADTLLDYVVEGGAAATRKNKPKDKIKPKITPKSNPKDMHRSKRAYPSPMPTRPPATNPAGVNAVFFESYRLFVTYTKRVTDDTTFKKFTADLTKLRQQEEGLRMQVALGAAKTFYDFNFNKNQQYTPVDVSISRLYDEKGLHHVWSGKKTTYCFASKTPRKKKGAETAPEIVPTAPEIASEIAPETIEIAGGVEAVAKARAAGKVTQTMKLIDLRCPICGILASKTTTLNSETVWNALKAASEIDMFYVFYESRCPSGGLHAWGNAENSQIEKCSKCGLTTAITKDVASGRAAVTEASVAYYQQHAARFSEDRAASQAIEPTIDVPASAPASPQTAPPPTWKSDYSLVVAAAELAGVTAATLDAIGATEGRDFNDVIAGKDAPEPPTSPVDPRIYAADAEVRYFISEYNQLKFISHNTTTKLPDFQLALLVETKFPKSDWPKLVDTLPDIGATYRQTLLDLLEIAPPATVLEFAIQSLCQFTMEIAAVTDTEPISQLRKLFAKRALQKIVHNQKLLSKPDRSIVVGDGDEEEEAQDDVGDVGEDVTNKDVLIANNGDEPIDPFSGENMDYDTSENESNNEPS